MESRAARLPSFMSDAATATVTHCDAGLIITSTLRVLGTGSCSVPDRVECAGTLHVTVSDSAG